MNECSCKHPWSSNSHTHTPPPPPPPQCMPHHRTSPPHITTSPHTSRTWRLRRSGDGLQNLRGATVVFVRARPNCSRYLRTWRKMMACVTSPKSVGGANTVYSPTRRRNAPVCVCVWCKESRQRKRTRKEEEGRRRKEQQQEKGCEGVLLWGGREIASTLAQTHTDAHTHTHTQMYAPCP